MATCPNCDKTSLCHALLSDDLPVHSCPACSGMLLSLIAYRRWHDLHASEATIPASASDLAIADTAGAKLCPKCARVMTKFRIAPDLPNKLDYCHHCEDIWLDEGEWELVEKLAVSGTLAEVLTQPWQRKVLRARTAQMEAARLRERLGQDYERLVALQEWLAGHPERELILAHLSKHATTSVA